MHAKLTEPLREHAALYALDALAPAERAEFDEHLAGGCPACAAEVASLGAVADNLALAAEPVTPRPAVRARVLAHDPFPFTLQGEGDWVEIAAGVFRKDLAGSPATGAISYLVRMEPQTRVAPHRHDSAEHCYVVAGDATINGRPFHAGDFTLARLGTEHDETTTDAGCLLLIVESRPELAVQESAPAGRVTARNPRAAPTRIGG